MRVKLQIILFSLLPFSLLAQESAKDIWNKMTSTLQSHQSLSYNADLRVKYADRQDTSYADGTVHMMRDIRDSIWGGMIWVGEGKKYESYSFYDMNRRYVVQNTIHRVLVEKARKGDIGLSFIYTGLLGIPFLEKGGRRPNPTEKMSLGQETIISGKPCYVVDITTFTGNSRVKNETYYISKADYFPLMLRRSETGGQSDVLIITSYEFDKVGPKQFSPDQVPASYRIDSRDKELPKNTQPPVRPRSEWPLPGRR